MLIDLRSDTVTKPSKAMMEAMMEARVGDDVYKEDPTVNELESYIAELFGKEEALFFPSGSMANQAAIKLHTQPGDQIICDKYAHVYNYEGGGASFNSGVSCKLLDGNRGMFTASQAEAAINPPDFYHSPRTSLIAVENTTNKGGGACWDFEEIKKIRSVCDSHGLGYHLDGARIWNALIKSGQSPRQYGELFDTISVCFSKGLGAPVGSMLIGGKEIMQDAIRIRKILGGGMRQVGYLAAAAKFAVRNQFERLAEDHRRAEELGKALAELKQVKHVELIETNIVIFELHQGEKDEAFIQKLKEHGILIIAMGGGKLRMVTHLDYTEGMHTKVLELLSAI